MGNAGVVSPWSIIPQSQPGTWKSIPGLLFGYGRPLSIHPKVALQMVSWGTRFLRQGRESHVRRSAEAMSHLCGPSIELYQRHLSGTGHENLITESAYVHAFRDGSRANLSNLDYRIRSEMGANLELVGRDRLATLEPALSSDFNAAVLIHGQARVRSPGQLGRVLSAKAQALGASIKRLTIRHLKKTATGWKIECDGQTLEAERVVVCMGVWSARILKEMAFDVPLVAERGYHVEFANPGIEIFNSIMDVDAKVVVSSMDGGVRIAGQAEFAPIDAPPSEKRSKRLVTVAKSAFPDLETKKPSFWMGRRPSFPDSLPMLGKVKDQRGLFVNFGHSHYGLMMAPKSGELMGQLVCEERSNTDLQAYSATRF